MPDRPVRINVSSLVMILFFSVVLGFFAGAIVIIDKHENYDEDACRNIAVEREDTRAFTHCKSKDFNDYYVKTKGAADYSPFYNLYRIMERENG